MTDLQKRFPIYAKLVWLYPAEYRKQFGDQILQTTADMLDHVDSSHDKRRLWLRISLDIPLSVSYQQVKYFIGEPMTNRKKIIVSLAWIAVAIVASYGFGELRKIGMTWRDSPGFLRLIGLSLFGLLLVVGPIVMAALSLFGIPKNLYRKIVAL
jgi:hypothetical protein